MYLSGNLLRRGTGLRQETVRFFLHPVITAVGHTILLLDAVYDLLYLAEHCFDSFLVDYRTVHGQKLAHVIAFQPKPPPVVHAPVAEYKVVLIVIVWAPRFLLL